MLTVKTRVRVTEGRLEADLPVSAPAGEYEAVIVIDAAAPTTEPKRFDISKFPIDDRPWDESISLRREDMYGDDGR